MLGSVPMSLKNLNQKLKDKEILRWGLIAELDAINFYEQLAEETNNENIKVVLTDIANEEKTHVGEFLEMLKKMDEKQVQEIEKGKKEVEELTKT